MVRIKPLSRSQASYLPQGNTAPRAPRNLDPALHPFEKAREYTRALNATKLERMFAQPFVGQIGDGHVDGVYSLVKDPTSLTRFASGSGDGEIKLWDVSERKEVLSVKAHDGLINGLTFTAVTGNTAVRDLRLLSCSRDRCVKLWDPSQQAPPGGVVSPIETYLGPGAFNSISYHRTQPTFATASDTVQVWDTSRTTPLTTMSFGTDTINVVRFNQIETSLLASAGQDRTLIFYDLRTNLPTAKLVTRLKMNALCWNPMEAFNFVAGSEDHNAYVFDMRKLERALNVLKDHVAAVMDVDYSPTGEEIVTASYDRTIRIFKAREGHSRDIYHTSRMQRVFQTKFTTDTQFLVSGSDDGNLRLWRSKASERSRILSAKEREKREYDNALKERYGHMPELRRISRHKHVPKVVKKAGAIKKVELGAIKTREENRRKHSAKGKEERRVPEREKLVLAVET
ncbi:WD40-repeat-containing domain protein [Peziza echinospora]|nr:WD40-repeat-containing domain protein [Peziza echinospora]